MSASIASLTTDRDVRDFLRWAQENLGFTAERTNGGHIRLLHPALSKPVFCPATPSDHRSLKNMRAQVTRELRNAGHQPNPEPEQETMPHKAPTPTTPRRVGPGKNVSTDELADWLRRNAMAPGARRIDLREVQKAFGDRDVKVAAHTLRRRRKYPALVLAPGHKKNIHLVVFNDEERERLTVTEEAPPEQNTENKAPAPEDVAKTNGHSPTAGRSALFEVVDQFVSGDYLVKDEEGNLFTATFRPL